MAEGKRKAISKDMRFAVYEKYNGHCAYCGCQIEYKDMQVDHIVSVYWYGGKNELSNYMPACRACNFYKSSMTLEKFRERLQTLTDRLKKEFIYKLALKYGLVKENNEPVRFYFEKVTGSSEEE